jgi:hypothetical protein
MFRSENVRDNDVVEEAGDGLTRVSIAALARASFHTERRVERHR